MTVGLLYPVIEQSLVYWLRSESANLDIDERIYPFKVPGGATFPVVIYQSISTPNQITHTGPSGYSVGRYQLGVVGKTYSEVRAVSQRLRIALNGVKGFWAGIEVQSVMVDQEFDAPEPSDTGLFRRVFEITIEYSALY